MKKSLRFIGLTIFWGLIILNYTLILNLLFGIPIKGFHGIVPNEFPLKQIILLIGVSLGLLTWFKIGMIDRWKHFEKKTEIMELKITLTSLDIIATALLVGQTAFFATTFLYWNLSQYIYGQLTFESIKTHHIIWTIVCSMPIIFGVFYYKKSKKVTS